VHDWDEFADSWDDAVGTQIYAEGAYRSLLDTLDARGLTLDGMRVLDFGCGTGLLTEFLVGRVVSVDGVDISPKMREVFASKIRARSWENVTVHADLPDDEMDLVVCSSVLGFVDDYTATVAELADRLAPGGLLVHWDWARDEEHPSEGGLTLEEIRSGLTDAGLGAVAAGVGFEASVEGEEMSPLMGAAQRPPSP
jgi:SAM-dependent methyltransferase